jgi:uncharacterized coiled-coil protein SlyX
MGTNIVKNEIKILLETLSEQYTGIYNHVDKIPQIELDIMMANVRKLYERLSDLNKLNAKEKAIYEVKPVVEENTTPIIPSIENNEKSEEKPAPTLAFIEPEEKVKIEEKKSPPVVTPELPLVAEEKLAENVVPEIEKPVKTGKSKKIEDSDLFSLAEKETVADKYKEAGKSMHEKMKSEKADNSIAEKMSKAPITNLKNTIGLNDKFLFINELFKGDIQEYNKAVDKLTMLTELEETHNYLTELGDRFRWTEKPDTYHKLEDLIIRKFLK